MAFSFLNPQAEVLLRRRHEELKGRSIWEEFPQVVGSQLEVFYREAVLDGRAVRLQDYYPRLQSGSTSMPIPHRKGWLSISAIYRGASGPKRTSG